MAKLTIRTNTNKPIYISYNGEILTLMVKTNTQGNKCIVKFEGSTNFVIDREEGFTEKLKNYRQGESHDSIK
jgi:hypothetical protein